MILVYSLRDRHFPPRNTHTCFSVMLVRLFFCFFEKKSSRLKYFYDIFPLLFRWLRFLFFYDSDIFNNDGLVGDEREKRIYTSFHTWSFSSLSIVLHSPLSLRCTEGYHNGLTITDVLSIAPTAGGGIIGCAAIGSSPFHQTIYVLEREEDRRGGAYKTLIIGRL